MRKGVIMEENGYTKAPQEGYYVPEEPNPGMAVAGMTCGILSIVLCCCSQYITLILAVVGLGLSGYVLAKQKAGTGMAIAGLVCSIFGLLISVCLIIVSLFFVANQNTILKEIQQLSALSGSLKI